MKTLSLMGYKESRRGFRHWRKPSIPEFLGLTSPPTGTSSLDNRDLPPIDRWRLDALLAPPKILNTAQAIASRIGVSPDFVRNVLVNEPESPVRKIGGRYFAIESELIDFFRSSRNKHNSADSAR
jgi:hypothetical protein